MAPIVQQPYNMFAQQKMAGYNAYQQQKRVPGQVVGETPEQFAAGKQAANSQTGAVSQPTAVMAKPQPTTMPVQTTPVRQNAQPITSMEQLAQAMGYTSPEQEERLRKASIANQRILAVGDALRHIGNIYNTVNYAPAQQFSKPVEEERTRYLQEKAMRDAVNRQYIAYQQAKAAQDAKIEQAERQLQYNAARDAAKMQAQQNQWETQNKERARQFDTTLGYKRENDEANRKQRQAQYDKQNKFTQQRIGLGWANHNLSKQKFDYLKSKGTNGGGGGSSSYDFATPNGTITMPKNFNQTQKDQVIAKFEKYIDRTEMQKQMRALGLNTQDPAQVRNFQFAKMLQEHQDVADYVTEKFKGKQTFASYPMARPEEKAPQPMFQTPWGGAAFAEENPYEQYLLSSEGDSDNDDYEQYLIQ